MKTNKNKPRPVPPSKEINPYMPNGAKLNFDSSSMQSPEVQYEKRKFVFNRDSVKKVNTSPRNT